MPIQTTNPATNKIIQTFEEMTDEQVDTAITKSESTFQEWKTNHKEKLLLHTVAKLMRKRKLF
jgi:succinate-semialdehyde dehydrogenase/glutarate-semialdehyde dehydrogenase